MQRWEVMKGEQTLVTVSSRLREKGEAAGSLLHIRRAAMMERYQFNSVGRRGTGEGTSLTPRYRLASRFPSYPVLGRECRERATASFPAAQVGKGNVLVARIFTPCDGQPLPAVTRCEDRDARDYAPSGQNLTLGTRSTLAR